MNTEYGRRLKTARKHAGLTQVELCKATGIPQSTISTAERLGQGSAETPVYARACGVDAHWLATGEGQMLGSPSTAPPPPPTKASLSNLADALRLIDEVLAPLDGPDRRMAVGMLSGLESPGRADRVASMLSAAIEATSSKRWAAQR